VKIDYARVSTKNQNLVLQIDALKKAFGEDVETALRFLFRTMSPKGVEDFPFQGIPAMIYMDKGPIARSHVFLQVMKYLGIQVRTHLPAGRMADAPWPAQKARSSGRFAPSRKYTQLSPTFMNPKTKTKPTSGSCVSAPLRARRT
jgi:hypothetical protein